MSWKIRQAAQILRKGGLIAYPTEAVYGLGCLAHFHKSIERLLKIKQRRAEKGLILLASDLSQLADYIQPLPPDILTQIRYTWPGPITWLLPAKNHVPALITGQYNTIAVRISAHPVVNELCRRSQAPLISTSANLSGKHMAYSAFEVRRQFDNQLDYILNAPLGRQDKPSKIIDALSGRVIRS